MPSFLCSTVVTWLKNAEYGETGCSADFGLSSSLPREDRTIIFPSQEPEKSHFSSSLLGWCLREEFQGCHSHHRASVLHGKSCCSDNTHVLPTATESRNTRVFTTPTSHGASLCRLASQPHPPHPCSCSPHPYTFSTSNETEQDSQTTTQTQIATQGKMTLSLR